MKTTQKIFFLAGLLFLLGCQSKEERLCNIINSMKEHSVTFPTGLTGFSIDDSLKVDSKEKQPFTMVIYFSPALCNACNLTRLSDYENLPRQFPEAKIVYILSYRKKNEEKEIKSLLTEINFRQFVYLDCGNMFGQENDFIPGNPLFQTFLLNDENKILIVGDPTQNQEIHNLYTECISEEEQDLQ